MASFVREFKMKKLLYGVFVAGCIVLVMSSFTGCCKENGNMAKDRVLVLYAFGAEGVALKAQMDVDTIEFRLGREVYIGKISGKEVVLAESGVGMNNAAMTTQKMIDLYHPTAVLLSGIAGAIDSAVHIGDIVVPDGWFEHDYGYIGNEGFVHSGIEAYSPMADSIGEWSEFKVDSVLFVSAVAMNFDETQLSKIGERHPRLIIGGVGVSGNTFVDSKSKRQWLLEKFGALTVDMESQAVVQVCFVNNVPCLIFRSASDLAGGSGSETARTEIEQFFKQAAENSAKVVMEYLKHIDAGGTK